MAKIRVKPIKGCVMIMSHPHLVKPQQFEPEKPGDPPPAPKYNCVGIISPQQQKTKAFLAMQKMVKEVRIAYFGGKTPKNLRETFRKCEEMWEEDERTGKVIQKPGYMKGGLFVSLNGGEEVADGWLRDQKMRPITNASVLYPGCLFVPVVSAYGYNFKGNRGISFGLRALQKCGEGENIAGRVNAEDYFDEIEGGDGDDDEDMDDDDDEVDDDDVI